MGFSGMLWFDSTKGRPIQERASRAIKWYKGKYKQTPQICLINPVQFRELEITEIDGISLRAYKFCLPNHFMPGFDNPVPPIKDMDQDAPH